MRKCYYRKRKPPDSDHAWMVKSFDDGKTWKQVIGKPEKDHGELYFVKFYNNYFGVAYRASYLYYTLDGGETWNIKFKPNELGVNVSSIEFTNEKTLLIGDMKLGMILKLTFHPSSNAEISKVYNLCIHPNPATDYIYINSEDLILDEATNPLMIYNSLGKYVSN